MLNALLSAASGMTAQQLHMDVIAHNLANVNTPGFKRATTEFQELLYTDALAPVKQGDTGLRLGHGIRVSNVERVFLAGSPQTTDNPYDLNIAGQGFFRLQGNGVESFTRDGSFHLDGEGYLVSSQGEFVLGAAGRIQVPTGATSVQITRDGQVVYVDPSKSADPSTPVQQVADRISIATFRNPAGLEALGDNRWGSTTASGPGQVGRPAEDGVGSVRSGELEMSNVSALDEMVNLLVAQRAYQLNSKVVQTADEMMSIANGIFRG